MKNRETLALVGVFVSAVIIFTKVLQPTTLQLVIDGEIIDSKSIPTMYTIFDLVTVSVASIVFGVCLYSLIRNNNSTIPVSANPEHWRATLESLVDPDEQLVYQLVVKEGGTMFQGELVDRSGFSKTKVSLILDRLEARLLLERKRYGMSNLFN